MPEEHHAVTVGVQLGVWEQANELIFDESLRGQAPSVDSFRLERIEFRLSEGGTLLLLRKPLTVDLVLRESFF